MSWHAEKHPSCTPTQAGATNEDGGRVTMTSAGNTNQIVQLVEVLGSGKHLNDWGAMVESTAEVREGKALAGVLLYGMHGRSNGAGRMYLRAFRYDCSECV